jgi:hypothetical protein
MLSLSRLALEPRSVRLAAWTAVVTLVAGASSARAQFGQEQLIDATFGAPADVHAADLDADGKLDLVVCRPASSAALVWYRNLGGGFFGGVQAFPQQPMGASQALTFDYGSDGDLDVVATIVDVASPLGPPWRIVLYQNLGGGSFAPPVALQGATIAHMEIGDLEADGDLDVFAARGVAIQVSIFQSAFFTVPPIEYSHSAGGITFFRLPDVDLDGRSDVISAATAAGQVAWFKNLGLTTPFSGPHVIDGAFPGVSSVESADVDGDGMRDIVAAGTSGSSQEVRWYKHSGTGPFSGPLPVASGGAPQSALCMDVDGDGDQDVVVEQRNGAAWYANAGAGNFGSSQVIVAGASTSTSMTLADVDGDGASDLVLGSDPGSGGRLAWFRNEANASTPFCFGDGSGAACPCGNAGGTGSGCASSVDPAGANLFANGAPSILNDSFVLVGAHMPNSFALYFQGTTQLGAGNGVAFGDGLRCVGGTIVRLGTKMNVAGTSAYPAPGDASISIRGGNAPGNVREYQCWYRNAAPFCTPLTYNLTNGLEATWVP